MQALKQHPRHPDTPPRSTRSPLSPATRRQAHPAPHGGSHRALVHAAAMLLLAGAALVIAPQPARAADPAALQSAMGLFQKATGGDAGAIDQAAAAWQALVAADPTDPLLRAYAGAATTLKATDTWMPWKKLSHVEDGLALIDKGLALLTPAHDAPGPRGVAPSLETRFTAASTFLSLPKMFNRHERGERLLADLLKSPLFESSPAPFKAVVWLRAGQEAAKAQRTDEARQWWQKAAATDTAQAAQAQARLKTL